jgi:hypothetical protein
MSNWYLSSAGYAAVPVWTNAARIVGTLRRQTAPAVNSERVFICIVAAGAGGAQFGAAVAEALALADRPLTGSIFDEAVAETLALSDGVQLLFAAPGYRILAGPARSHVQAGPPRDAVQAGAKRLEVV